MKIFLLWGITMKVKCEFCGNYFEDTEQNCPCCGGANTAVGGHRFSNCVPKTIEELRLWAEQHNVPLAKMQMYIGYNSHSPKCIGIYREGTDVIVYKNKSDGTRAVRYQGSDEAYAVNEVYLKIKEMMSMAAASKRTPGSNGSAASYGGYTGGKSSSSHINGDNGQNDISAGSAIGRLAVIIIIIVIIASLPSCMGGVGRFVRGYSSGSYGSGGYNSGYNSNTYPWGYDDDSDDDFNWDWDSNDDSDWDSDWDSDDDSDWDSDWDSDYGDYDWDFDYDWDSDW